MELSYLSSAECRTLIAWKQSLIGASILDLKVNALGQLYCTSYPIKKEEALAFFHNPRHPVRYLLNERYISILNACSTTFLPQDLIQALCLLSRYLLISPPVPREAIDQGFVTQKLYEALRKNEVDGVAFWLPLQRSASVIEEITLISQMKSVSASILELLFPTPINNNSLLGSLLKMALAKDKGNFTTYQHIAKQPLYKDHPEIRFRALHLAAQHGHVKIVKDILETLSLQEIRVVQNVWSDYASRYPLFAALKANHYDTALLLYEKGLRLCESHQDLLVIKIIERDDDFYPLLSLTHVFALKMKKEYLIKADTLPRPKIIQFLKRLIYPNNTNHC